MFNKENLENLENLENFKEKKVSEKTFLNKNKVDINILLNRVRADKKKERIESIIFIGIISIAIIATGIIISFR